MNRTDHTSFLPTENSQATTKTTKREYHLSALVEVVAENARVGKERGDFP